MLCLLDCRPTCAHAAQDFNANTVPQRETGGGRRAGGRAEGRVHEYRGGGPRRWARPRHDPR